MKILLLTLTVLLVIPNFISLDMHVPSVYNNKEKFNPGLGHINSIPALEHYTDSIAAVQNIHINSLQYWLIADSLISSRFYHGFSAYSLNENWIAVLTDKITHTGVSNKVFTADIMKDLYGACSQQAAVMMQMAKRRRVDFRSVGFPHHYAIELKLNNTWYFFDSNLEPAITPGERMNVSWMGNGDKLKQYYATVSAADLDYEFGINKKAEFGVINGNPAPKLKVFQTISQFLSRFAWLLPLTFLLIYSSKKSAAKFPALAVAAPNSNFPYALNA